MSEACNIFYLNFDKMYCEIHKKLLNLTNLTDQNIINTEIIQIKSDIKSLQDYFQEHLIVLTDYDIRSHQILLNSLNNELEQSREKLNPKKKFGFSKKKQNYSNKDEISEKTVSDSNTTTLKFNSQDFGYNLSDKRNEHIVLPSEVVHKKAVTLKNISKCIIEINGICGTLQMTDIVDCFILCGPVSRAVFVNNCENTSIAVACQQLRIHSCKNCDMYIHTVSKAIIEDCNNIRVAKYNYVYETISSDLSYTSMDCNPKIDVIDFNWLSQDQPSPNWSLLEETCNWSDRILDFRTKNIR